MSAIEFPSYILGRRRILALPGQELLQLTPEACGVPLDKLGGGEQTARAVLDRPGDPRRRTVEQDRGRRPGDGPAEGVLAGHGHNEFAHAGRVALNTSTPPA